MPFRGLVLLQHVSSFALTHENIAVILTGAIIWASFWSCSSYSCAQSGKENTWGQYLANSFCIAVKNKQMYHWANNQRKFISKTDCENMYLFFENVSKHAGLSTIFQRNCVNSDFPIFSSVNCLLFWITHRYSLKVLTFKMTFCYLSETAALTGLFTFHRLYFNGFGAYFIKIILFQYSSFWEFTFSQYVLNCLNISCRTSMNHQQNWVNILHF